MKRKPERRKAYRRCPLCSAIHQAMYKQLYIPKRNKIVIRKACLCTSCNTIFKPSRFHFWKNLYMKFGWVYKMKEARRALNKK